MAPPSRLHLNREKTAVESQILESINLDLNHLLNTNPADHTVHLYYFIMIYMNWTTGVCNTSVKT